MKKPLKDKIIIYEKLNIFTFCLSIIAGFYFKSQRFIAFSPFIKKYFSGFVKRRNLTQIHRLCFLLGRGTTPRASEKAIEMGNKVVEDNVRLAIPFMRYMNDPRALSLAKRIFTRSIYGDVYAYTILKEAIIDNKDKACYYFPTTKNFIIDRVASRNTRVIKWHFPLLNIAKAAKGSGYFLCLLAAPLSVALKLMIEGRVILRKNRQRPATGTKGASNGKKIIFFHRYEALLKDENNICRAMYLFNSGILKLKDCVHTCLEKRPFSREKAEYLRKAGGETFNYHKQKIYIADIWNRAFVDYYRCFFPYFYALSFNRFSAFSVIRSVISIIYKVINMEALLKRIDAKLGFFEGETALAPNIFTILANKRNIKTMTMLHGYGGYCFPDYVRSNTVVNYYIVPGNYYTEYLERHSPHVDKFCPVGNHEIEELITDTCSKDRLKSQKMDKKKVIGVLFTFYPVFFPEYQSGIETGLLFNEDDARKAFLHYWLPFFKWAGRQNNLFFIFKGKDGTRQYEHPFLKEVMPEIPKDRFYQEDHDILMKDVIAISDCTICGADGNASSFFSSLCFGTPAIAYNISMTGYTAAEQKKYNKYFIARDPGELITNLTCILEKGLPESAFEKIREDHHVKDGQNGRPSLRIKRLITDIVSEG